jgi:hypothetical protein
MPPYFDKAKGHTVYPEEGPNFSSSPQFKGYTGGPEEAHRRLGMHEDEDYVEPHHEGYGQERVHDRYGVPQGQLFDPDKSHLEAHQQTPSQFAADPRTWWHGRYTMGGRLSTLSGVGSGPGMETSGEGFHAGTREAAEERLTGRQPQDVWADHRGHLYPLRITGPVEGPENVHVDTGFHGQLGEARRHGPGYLYENMAEDPESISVGTPRRKGFLSTHREMVQAAQQRGEHVHPLIEWAARMHPEHEGEEWEHPRLAGLKKKYPDVFGHPPDTGQMSLFDADEVAPEQRPHFFRYFKAEGGHTLSSPQFSGHGGLSPSELEHGPMGEAAF